MGFPLRGLADSDTGIGDVCQRLDCETRDKRVDPFNFDTVYLRKVGQYFRTSDGGRNWEQIGPRAGMLNESSLALHPSEPGVLYFGTQGGVFRSIDRGDTWQALLTVSVSDISICSTVPGVMYVAGRTLQRSQDAGET